MNNADVAWLNIVEKLHDYHCSDEHISNLCNMPLNEVNTMIANWKSVKHAVKHQKTLSRG